ncbi:uncharacterized protein LOC110841593 [Folsomia candida]|uniref:Chitin-binding type-2 domain-containing protein n=1 Tax=Folsomia candida TaxID=158441 RepID=A0A226F4J6_FOLCA|nr:uncharacterized protein LOC110841593 [Folsomia candida]OXA64280.1 hypothetical protein Fcan01_01630 [Folsomia candida]
MKPVTSLSIFLVLVAIAWGADTDSDSHEDSKASRYSRPNYDHIDYYDCSGKPNGQYIHPSDCTRFIICSNGYASDMACPNCDLANTLCFGIPFLRYDAFKERCEWPKITECIVDPPPTDTPEETEGTTAEATTTTKKTTTTTTEEPTTQTPVANITICHGITAGLPCGKNQCQPCGYCWNLHSFYFRCQRDFPSDPKLDITGVWVHESCDGDLWWDPDLKPSSGVEDGFGGACNKWDNLSNATRDGYLADENCVIIPEVCEWGQDEEDKCTGRYWYYDPKHMEDREDLECPDGLKWDQASETCRKCVDGCEC